MECACVSTEGYGALPHEVIGRGEPAGVIVATRRKAALVDALRVVEWILTNIDADLQSVVTDLSSEELGYLLSELGSVSDAMATDLDVPQLRRRCATVAAALE